MYALADADLERFVSDGYLVVRGAVAPELVRACVGEIEVELRARGVNPADRSTWTEPVVRVPCPWSPAFAAAGTAPALWGAYDALVGPDRWEKRRGVGGSVPVRFPSERDPGDAGWHIDASFQNVDGEWSLVNLRSRGRGLLALFLFSDVSDCDAPTELIAGSHFDVPRVLESFGDEGRSFNVASELPARTFARPRVLATGRAGDVFLCHPFVVHRATWPHRGSLPRILAQPGVALLEPFALRDRSNVSPVERAILRGLVSPFP